MTPDNCPETGALLLHAIFRHDQHVEQHLTVCSRCALEVGKIREQALAISVAAPTVSGSCLDDLSIAELADGVLDDTDRSRVITHLSRCKRCMAKVASVVAALAAAPVGTEVRRLESQGKGPRRWLIPVGSAATIAAVAAVAMFILVPSENDFSIGAPAHRDPTVTATILPVTIFPEGDVPVADALIWSSVPGADIYQLTLFDEEGSIVNEWLDVRDTTVVVPDTVTLTPLRPYFWQVDARIDINRWVKSDLVGFRISRAVIQETR